MEFDGSLVAQEVLGGIADAVIVASAGCVTRAWRSGFTVVAEGVETIEQRHGCGSSDVERAAQGYLSRGPRPTASRHSSAARSPCADRESVGAPRPRRPPGRWARH